MRDWITTYRRLMPFIDLVLVLASFRLAYTIRYDWQILKAVDEAVFASAAFDAFLPYAAAYALWFVFTWPVVSLYREVRGRSWFEEVWGIVNGATNATVLVMALNFLLRPQVFSRLMILWATALVIVLIALERLAYRIIRRVLRRRGFGVERVLIVGAGETGRAVLSAIIARPDLGYVPVGYLDDRPERGLVDMGRVKGLGDLDQLPGLLADKAVDLVIVTLPWLARQKIMDIVQDCEHNNVLVRVVPDLFQLNLSQVRIENLEGIPLLGLSAQTRMDRTKQIIKRVMDLAVVILTAPISVPLGLIIAIAIKLDSPGPIFFPHRRVGKDGREFNMYKFRSMFDGADHLRDTLIRQTGADPRRPKWENDPRITRIGKFLRHTSLDEIPQAINVLLGDMSMVGPRPPTPDEVSHYVPWQRQRLNTLPGVTSLWQVSGRSKVPFEEQCLLDIYYIDNWSIGLDIQIMMRTIPNVLLGDGAY